jgi:hypothetical protein
MITPPHFIPETTLVLIEKINFLEYNEIDNVIDINKFGSGYEKTKANSGGFFGYPDSEILEKHYLN